MPTLKDFTEDEQKLLVSLPYKVGMYISHAEDESGELDDKREAKALEHCLKAIAKRQESRPFNAEIVAQTLSNEDQWEDWLEESFHAPKLAQKARDTLVSKLNEMEYKHFYRMIMEVAGTVARAYGEFGDDWESEEEEGFFKNVINKVVERFSTISETDKDHPMNISAAEQSAMRNIAEALRPS